MTTAGYVLRKTVDRVLTRVSGTHEPLWTVVARLGKGDDGFPSAEGGGWQPLYTMVTFRPDMSYRTAKKKAERQSTITTGIGLASAGLGVWIGLAGLYRAARLWT